jgi:hypothetical protein
MSQPRAHSVADEDEEGNGRMRRGKETNVGMEKKGRRGAGEKEHGQVCHVGRDFSSFGCAFLLRLAKIRCIRDGSECKMHQIIIYKIKKSGKYIKKLDEILRLPVKNFFQIGIIWLVKI